MSSPGAAAEIQGTELTSGITLRRGSSHNQPHATGTTGAIPRPLYRRGNTPSALRPYFLAAGQPAGPLIVEEPATRASTVELLADALRGDEGQAVLLSEEMVGELKRAELELLRCFEAEPLA